MKPNKSPRIGLTHRSRSSRSNDPQHSHPAPRPTDAPAHYQEDARASSSAPGRPQEESAGMDDMRRRMSAALVLKQQQKHAFAQARSTPPASDSETGEALAKITSSSEEDLPSGTLSTDSAKTVKAAFDATLGTIRTPSYPFPRMQLKLNRGTSHRSTPSHKPFTLLSPTGAPESSADAASGQTPTSDTTTTPVGGDAPGPQNVLDDPNYPTPDLYSTLLVLNSEPGLDAWWANVAQILAEGFGAERASLAVPGDLTDLENVPWGQKATYNLYGSEREDGSVLGSSMVSEMENIAPNRDPARQRPITGATSQTARRPDLVSRHSIAGVTPEISSRLAAQRPSGPPRAVSTLATHREGAAVSTPSPRLTRQPLRRPSTTSTESPIVKALYDSSASGSSTVRCTVHRSIQPLEHESDALLVRTGVSSLFGKRRPVVLTRVYNESEPYPEEFRNHNIKFRDPPPRQQSTSSLSEFSREAEQLQRRTFDEYLQPEPSPWSQSPSPSPAARPDPAESPFFTMSARVDETAFEQNPPAYDYRATANQSLGAIGADTSKTVLHIPLLQPTAAGLMAPNLRFPVAILSLLSPINPYPRNLRESLTLLLPHLASSYTLAQQYSILQERLRGPHQSVRSAAFGLGGTFSDEGSEMELVAELSEQAAAENGRTSQTHSAATSPSELVSLGKDSRPGSTAGTPLLEQMRFASGRPTTPGRSGAEMVDSYFSAKRQKGGSGNQVTTPGVGIHALDSPDRVKKADKKPQPLTTRSASRKDTTHTRPEESRMPAPPRSASLTSESEQWDVPTDSTFRRISFLQDTGNSLEKPLPDLISQLMLNSVPLQLFLAKPSSGDLVWTNRKFDAFRSQGEERVRDPWKNVHLDDRPGLIQGWSGALKSGTQFTHYVRVKRFNSDSDYRWFVFRASTLLSNTGRLLYWIGSFLDMHEQYIKTLEANEKEASMARDAKLRALADSIPQILFEAVDGEGIVAVNQQWHAYSGQTLEAARGLGFSRHVHPDDLLKCGLLTSGVSASLPARHARTLSQPASSSSSDRTIEPSSAAVTSWQAPDSNVLTRLISQGIISTEKDENGRLFYTTEIRLRSKGGEFRWFLIRLVKVESRLINSGRPSWYGTCTDIESRKALERELGEANKKIHREMESKTKFFANMSHEIRTPLNGILGSMPWLVESDLDHDQRRTVDTIQNSSNNLRELVDNILDVTKVEAGKMKLIHKWFHVRTLLEEIIDTISSRAIERSLELNYTVDANVPSTVKGDPFRLRQILLNLMGNSVKFTQQGEVYTRCYLHKLEGSDKPESENIALAFDVVDTGRGFNPTEFQRIFQQFGQIDGASSHDAGSGLGLFLSKQLVEMHGGHLTAKSEAGEGSTFTFYISVEGGPLGVRSGSPPPARPSQYRSSASYSGSPRSRSDSKTPTMSWVRHSLQSPNQSGRVVASPETQSPSVLASESSDPSLRSQSIHLIQRSTSSMLPTPESMTSGVEADSANERQALAEKAMASIPAFRRSRSDNDGSGLAPEQAHPTTYSIIVICPAEFARAAIKQHIEQVVPHQIAVNVTTIADIGAFLDLMHRADSPTFTHIVLDLPASSDVMLFLRQMSNFTAPILPDVIVITDHYQKRDVLDDYNALIATGRKAYLIHKPVKPAVFALIFDPAQLRNLSKDAARSMAQTSSDDFKNTAARVKDAIGNKDHRVLLVEDSDTNRKVILKYLSKVDLASDYATNGLECTDMVLAKPHGYYSLIICDIQMPIKDGYQACQEIRDWETANAFPPAPIMALTANAMPEERAAAAEAGFTDYLTKPVNFNVLGRMMTMLLDARNPHVFLKDRPPES